MGMVGVRDVLVVAPAASFHAAQHHHHHDQLLPTAEHPIIPLLSAGPCLIDDPHDAARAKTIHHLWQPQPQQQPPPLSFASSPNPNPDSTLCYPKKPVHTLDAASILAGGGGVGTGASSTCQDCGNQAKKDCSHRRCRTCCKSRGFDCSTHVKSTWVPATRRRERQLSATAATAAAAGSSLSTAAAKKPRLISSQTTNTTTSHTSTSNNTPPRSFDTSSSHQEASFREGLPGHVRAPAVFKCVRMTYNDNGEDEFAYQALVSIGGHVFKGFLYDQGPDDGRGEQSSDANNAGNNSRTIPNISELHLGGGGGSGPSDVYGSATGGGGGLLGGGASFGNAIN